MYRVERFINGWETAAKDTDEEVGRVEEEEVREVVLMERIDFVA